MTAVPKNAQRALIYALKMLWMGEQLTRSFAENVPPLVQMAVGGFYLAIFVERFVPIVMG
jgi:hypothetical protein